MKAIRFRKEKRERERERNAKNLDKRKSSESVVVAAPLFSLPFFVLLDPNCAVCG
jgi:hypothetical protein